MKPSFLSNKTQNKAFLRGVLAANTTDKQISFRRPSNVDGEGILVGLLMDGAAWNTDKVTFTVTVGNKPLLVIKDEIGTLENPCFLPISLKGGEEIGLHIENKDSAAHAMAVMVSA